MKEETIFTAYETSETPAKLESLAFPVSIKVSHKATKTREPLFTVTYGQQVKPDLSYNSAAKELGACLMHALTCDGRLYGN